MSDSPTTCLRSGCLSSSCPRVERLALQEPSLPVARTLGAELPLLGKISFVPGWVLVPYRGQQLRPRVTVESPVAPCTVPSLAAHTHTDGDGGTTAGDQGRGPHSR